MNSKALKTVILNVVTLFIIIVGTSTLAYTQGVGKRQKLYKGFQVAFGVKASTITSNLKQISRLSLLTEGGSIGIVYGNNIFRTRLSGGFFYSAASVPYTIDQFQANLATSFYPFGLTKLKTRLMPYILAGVSFDKFKFAGQYLSNDRSKPYTGSDVYEGKVNQANLSSGLGISYKLRDDFDFLHLYMEIKSALPMTHEAINTKLSSTSSGRQISVSVGVRFGAKS